MAAQALLKTSLGYPPVAGTPELQALVAKWHGAEPDDVLVTVGCSEVRTLGQHADLASSRYAPCTAIGQPRAAPSVPVDADG